MKTVEDMHFEWKYILWTEENLGKIINQEKFKLINNSNKSLDNKYTNLANLIRYEKLYEHGGIYIDADSLCNKSFNNLLNCKFFVAYENERKRPGLIANGVIGSIPGHPVLQECIKEIKIMKKRFIIQKPSFKTTGPFLLTKIIKKYGKDKIDIHPSWYFYPVHYTDIINKKIDPDKDSYTKQFWHSTIKEDNSIIKRGFNRLTKFLF